MNSMQMRFEKGLFIFCEEWENRWRQEEINSQKHSVSLVKTEMPSFACIGKDCKFETSAPTEAELMKKITEHAKNVHHLDPIPPDMMVKVKAAIKS